MNNHITQSTNENRDRAERLGERFSPFHLIQTNNIWSNLLCNVLYQSQTPLNRQKRTQCKTDQEILTNEMQCMWINHQWDIDKKNEHPQGRWDQRFCFTWVPVAGGSCSVPVVVFAGYNHKNRLFVGLLGDWLVSWLVSWTICSLTV